MISADTPRRLLFITRKWPPAVGGMEVYSREMAVALAERRHMTTVCLPGRANGAPPRVAALILFVLRCVFHLIRHAGRYDEILIGDVVLASLVIPARLFHANARVAVAMHGTDVALPLRKGLLPRIYAGYLFMITACRGVTVFIANSPATARLAARAGLAPIAVVPLGAHLASVREPVVASNSPYLLFVGRLARRKGAAWFADQVLPRLPPELRLRVAGPHWDGEELESLRLNPRVDLLGPVFGEELSTLRREALCVIVPNIPMGQRDFEGFGLVALEAAADGGVVLASDLDGLSAAVQHERTGFLLPPENPAAWAEKIISILSWSRSERATFLANARSELARNFSWDKVAQRTLDALGGRAAIFSTDPSTKPLIGPKGSAAARRIAYGVGTALFLASFVFVLYYAQRNWASLDKLQAFSPSLVLLSALIYGVSHVSTALCWPVALRSIGQPIPLSVGIPVGLVAQIGKYLPGNVAHYVGRAVIAADAGVSIRTSGISTAVELLSALLAAVFVIFVALVIDPGPIAFVYQRITGAAAAATAVTILSLAGLATAVLYFTRKGHGVRVLIGPAPCLAVSFILSGLSFFIVLAAFDLDASPAPVIAVFVLAWAIGFIVPGAPAGLGVREAILIAFLSPSIGSGAAIACALLHRVVTAGIDLIAALIGYVWLALAKKKKSANEVLSGSREFSG